MLAAATWVFIAVAWSFALWTRRGAWNPTSLTTSAYLDITIRRCRSSIRTSLFAMLFYCVEMVFCLGWIYNRKRELGFLVSPVMLGAGAATVVLFVYLAVYRTKKKRALACLMELEESLRRDSPNTFE